MTRDTGAVLLVCLMLLAALSLLGLAAASDHLLNERMSKNLVEAADVERLAGRALEWGESWLLGIPGDQKPVPCASTCPTGSVVRSPGATGTYIERRDEEWWRNNAYLAGADPQTGSLITPGGLAFWLIEEVHSEPARESEPPAPETTWYRLTARSADTQTGVYAVTESILARPWGEAAWKDDFPPAGANPGFCYGIDDDIPCGRQAWRKAH